MNLCTLILNTKISNPYSQQLTFVAVLCTIYWQKCTVTDSWKGSQHLTYPPAPSPQVGAKSYCYCWTSFLDVVSESVWPAWLPPLCYLCPWPVSAQLCFKETDTERTPKQILFETILKSIDTTYCSTSLCLYFGSRKEWLVENKTNDKGNLNLNTGTKCICSFCDS